jgi:hypothetical protein
VTETGESDHGVPVFAALDIGTTIDGDGRSWPTVVIDVAGHPEVADLARVHATEGIGDIATAAALVDDALVLAVMITVPVRCTFAVACSLPQHRSVLDDAVREGHLVIATTEPTDAERDQPLWLAIDIDAELLADVLPEG